MSEAAGFLLPVPGVRTLEANPDAVFAVSAGGAATSDGAGIPSGFGAGAAFAGAFAGAAVASAGLIAGFASGFAAAAACFCGAASAGLLCGLVGVAFFAQPSVRNREKDIMIVFRMARETASSVHDVQAAAYSVENCLVAPGHCGRGIGG